MIYIAIPTITPRLENCARWAIARTTPEPHRVIVARGRSHGENLDAAFAGLPEDAEWFFTMDDDAAPLRVGWLSWLLKKTTEPGRVNLVTFGHSRAVGALYRVAALRRVPGVSFVQPVGGNPGEQIDVGFVRKILRVYNAPLWLRNCEAYRDGHGNLIFAHLGGGTIGHTWYHRGRLYPRIPTWLWPVMVKRYLRKIVGPQAQLVHGRPHDARMVRDHAEEAR